MAVTSETRTDAQIQSDVITELKWDPRAQPNEIGVIVKNGVVTLTGTVKSAAEKAKIAQLAHNAAQGVKIDNQIEVKASE